MCFGWFPILLANLRKLYPDEERGIRNHVLSLVGSPPIDIPTPANLQPVWSGAPYGDLKDVKPNCKYFKLQLDKIFVDEDRLKEAEDYY